MSNKFGNLRDAYKHFEENSGGNSTFFQLKNDRETAVVRFLHEGEDDLDWYIVHEAEIQGKKRKVKCTEQGDCPLCRAGNRPSLKLFLQLLNKKNPDQIEIWERGQTFVPVVLSFIQRYGTLCGQSVEIERLGKPRDPKTTYQLYPLEKDNKTLDQLPKQREQLASENGFVLVKSQQELEQIAMGTYIPPQEGNNNNQGYQGNQMNQGYQGQQHQGTWSGNQGYEAPPQGYQDNQAPPQGYNQMPPQGYNEQPPQNEQPRRREAPKGSDIF